MYAATMAFGIVLGFIAIFAAVVGAAVYCWYIYAFRNIYFFFYLYGE